MINKLPSLPIFGLRKKHQSTHELVFRILSRSFPHTINELQIALKKKFNKNISYQAVRKSILALRELGVIEQSADGYQLSLDWLVNVRATVDEALQSYRSFESFEVEFGAAFQTFVADSLYEADTIWGDILLSICTKTPKSQRSKFISINHFPWWLPINIGREAALFNKLQQLGFEVNFVFTNNNSSFQWAQKFYKSINVRSYNINPKNLPKTHYYNIIGTMVIEVILNATMANKIENLFGSGFTPEKLRPELVTKLSSTKTEIKISVYNNAVLAQSLKDIVNCISLDKI